ncbi:MAG: cytochrome P460 family protein [Woeseiaceae bacterium]|nr:cytochrome P460 family protein [Woeseiaceae bacterium]
MQKLILSTVCAAALFIAVAATAEGPRSIHVAEFDEQGRLVVPDNMDEWVFIGSSLGMGYSQADFDADSPGMFQIARMEPTAYQVFKDTGEFVDGTMISLHFYGSQNEISINRAGFVMDDLHFAEIHYKDSQRFPDGFNFYNVNNGDTRAEEIALPNDCVDCHKRDGAYDGVFVQFYPTIHKYLPEAVQARLRNGGGRHGH